MRPHGISGGSPLQTDVHNPPPARLVGRADLLATVESQLAASGSVVLSGSSGIGKTAVMDALGSPPRTGVNGCFGSPGWKPTGGFPTPAWPTCSAVVPVTYLAEPPDPQRSAVNAVLQRGGSSAVGSRGRLARRMAWHALLERCALAGPVLILIDDAQWSGWRVGRRHRLRGPAGERAGHPRRRRPAMARSRRRWRRAIRSPRTPYLDPGDGDVDFGAIDGGEDGDGGLTDGVARLPVRAAALAPGAVLELVVPPLDATDLAELFDLYALPARAAGKLHADSGGNPYLALALGGAFADRPSVTWRPVPMPQRLHALLRDRVARWRPTSERR